MSDLSTGFAYSFPGWAQGFFIFFLFFYEPTESSHGVLVRRGSVSKCIGSSCINDVVELCISVRLLFSYLLRDMSVQMLTSKSKVLFSSRCIPLISVSKVFIPLQYVSNALGF